jgi:hypothetical protein
MVETIAFATICFFLAGGAFGYRLKKGAGGAILFVALHYSYTILSPLLPTEIDNLLHSTVWGVLFAYAVPTEQSKKMDEEPENDGEEDGEEKDPEEDSTPPISDLN